MRNSGRICQCNIRPPHGLLVAPGENARGAITLHKRAPATNYLWHSRKSSRGNTEHTRSRQNTMQNVWPSVAEAFLQFPQRPAGASDSASVITKRLIGVVQNRNLRHQAVRALSSFTVQENQAGIEN